MTMGVKVNLRFRSCHRDGVGRVRMIADVFCNFDRLRKGVSSVDRVGDFNWRKEERRDRAEQRQERLRTMPVKGGGRIEPQ